MKLERHISQNFQKELRKIFIRIFLKTKKVWRGPIIGLRLHGFDPIFTCGLRIWQWFFNGLRLQQKMRLASSAVNWQRFAAFGMRMQLLVERTACGQVIDFIRNGVKKISGSRRNMIRII